MHFVTLRIDRVFDLQRLQTSKAGKVSTFGFEIAGKKIYGLQMWDWPAIESGMTITAALMRHEDIKSLKGWYDHRTGQVVSPSPRGLQWLAWALWLLLAGMALGLPFFGYRSTAPASVAWFLGAALASGATWLHVLHHRYTKLRTELGHIGAQERACRVGKLTEHAAEGE